MAVAGLGVSGRDHHVWMPENRGKNVRREDGGLIESTLVKKNQKMKEMHLNVACCMPTSPFPRHLMLTGIRTLLHPLTQLAFLALTHSLTHQPDQRFQLN